MDTFSDREYFDLSTKIVYVLLSFLTLYGLNSLECIEAPIEGENYKSPTQSIEQYKVIVGLILFSFFLLYGLIYPLATRIGCCGQCRRTDEELAEDVDHMMYEEHQVISAKMMQAINFNDMNKSRQSVSNDKSRPTTVRTR